ncbi:unnamed protein product [Peniophora sp. CBMAI 1063]|nr:unnamed protein product [Peniophora sp. CBMAI 1063]
MAPLSELDSLQRTLNQAIDSLRDELNRQSLPELTSKAHRHPMDDYAFLCSPRLYEARRLTLAAIGEIKNLVQFPFEKVVEQACAVYDTACLDILVKTGLVDKLAEPSVLNDGMDVHDLQEALDMDAIKLTVVLRDLSSQGWLRERREGTFALARPALELIGTSAGRMWALNTGRPLVAQALMDQLTHPEWKYSHRANHSAFQLSHKTDLAIFDWMKLHPDRASQLSKTIQAVGDAYRVATVNDFPWKKLEGRTFVDCAGGQGNLSIILSEILPQSQFIVQDLPEVIATARENIARTAPAAAQSARIIAEVANIFDVQPRRGEGFVYLLRLTLHNWSDEACISILKNIASVMSPTSKLILLEVVAQPNTLLLGPGPAPGVSCEPAVTLDTLIGEETYRPITSPEYIPTNFGAAARTSLTLDIQMMALFNAQERTQREWTVLANSAGLHVVDVHAFRGTVSALECELSRP